jgi:hypothetical protein
VLPFAEPPADAKNDDYAGVDMKKKTWLVGALGALLMLTAGSASAGISRESIGKFSFKNTQFHAQDGTFLGSINDPWSFHYVTAIGRYGGGDTASGRRTAKVRAAQKTYDCMSAFYSYGLLGNNGVPWNKYCGRSGYSEVIDPDITLISNWWAYYTIENVAHYMFCDRARQLAQQFAKTGPVTVTGAVDAFSDTAGTEEDHRVNLGTQVALCY